MAGLHCLGTELHCSDSAELQCSDNAGLHCPHIAELNCSDIAGLHCRHSVELHCSDNVGPHPAVGACDHTSDSGSSVFIRNFRLQNVISKREPCARSHFHLGASQGSYIPRQNIYFWNPL